MKIIRSLNTMSQFSEGLKRRGRTLGFVPTMGALHQGHLSLIEKSRRENDLTAVSIFVNPLQFAPSEDYRSYPRPTQTDESLCRKARVDVLFRPSAEEMYPPGFNTSVDVGPLSDLHEGEFRPGHFRGVATVVLKLFEAVRPTRAYFGEKDFQQLVIIRRMVRDLHLPLLVVACRTVREADGLALSSRNAYLSPRERERAAVLFRALSLGAKTAEKGASAKGLLRLMTGEIRRIPKTRIDYIRIVRSDTLEEVESLRGRLRMLGAVRIGKTRLIDNIALDL